MYKWHSNRLGVWKPISHQTASHTAGSLHSSLPNPAELRRLQLLEPKTSHCGEHSFGKKIVLQFSAHVFWIENFCVWSFLICGTGVALATSLLGCSQGWVNNKSPQEQHLRYHLNSTLFIFLYHRRVLSCSAQAEYSLSILSNFWQVMVRDARVGSQGETVGC